MNEFWPFLFLPSKLKRECVHGRRGLSPFPKTDDDRSKRSYRAPLSLEAEPGSVGSDDDMIHQLDLEDDPAFGNAPGGAAP